MKTRYKILIIVCLSFIPISFFFPQVFLIFHLDKYETNEQCDKVNGEWDWIYDTCKLDYLDRALGRLQCKDIEAIPRCEPCYPESAYSPWPRMLSFGCLDMCRGVCEFKKPGVTLHYDPIEEDYLQLQNVLDHCHAQELMAKGELESDDGTIIILDAIGYYYYNNTHYIDNNTCEWEKVTP